MSRLLSGNNKSLTRGSGAQRSEWLCVARARFSNLWLRLSLENEWKLLNQESPSCLFMHITSCEAVTQHGTLSRSTQARATRTKTAKVSPTTRITRSMAALRSDRSRASRGEVAKESWFTRITRSMTALRNDRPRATWKEKAKLNLFTRFTRSMTARKDGQAQAKRTTEAEASSSTRVTRGMSPPKSDPFPLLKLPLELFENVLEFCDADPMSFLRLTGRLLERQIYHEWNRRRRTIEFNSHQDKPEVYARILEACPQLGAKVTRLILAPPDGHQSDSPWRRAPLLAILPRLIKHLPQLQHLEIRYWALQYNLPSLAELAPIFEETKIKTLTLDRCVLYGSDLKALLGKPLVAPDYTLLKECSIM